MNEWSTSGEREVFVSLSVSIFGFMVVFGLGNSVFTSTRESYALAGPLIRWLALYRHFIGLGRDVELGGRDREWS